MSFDKDFWDKQEKARANREELWMTAILTIIGILGMVYVVATLTMIARG